MSHADRVVTVAGVDGCKKGWIGVIRQKDAPVSTGVFATFADLIDSLPLNAVVAVDMPIGLPELTGPGGRGPEALVRPLLEKRKSSVFSIPSRGAIYASTIPFTTIDRWYQDHRDACRVARQTSAPPRGVSIQAFAIFTKIREIDLLLRARPDLRDRVIESHPEVAFWRLNGERAMETPKKIKGRINPAGMAERRAVLEHCGLDRRFVTQPAPADAYADDFLDACAMFLVAERFSKGEATSFPQVPMRDLLGIPIAIWT